MAFSLLLFLGCKQQLPVTGPEPTPTIAPAEDPVNEVGTGISDISKVDKDLDNSGLDDLDTILEDIENI